jgi:hypothetical protein
MEQLSAIRSIPNIQNLQYHFRSDIIELSKAICCAEQTGIVIYVRAVQIQRTYWGALLGNTYTRGLQ